jgi:hypothetical protein
MAAPSWQRANDPLFLNQLIIETERSNNQAAHFMTTFGPKTKMMIGFWNVRTLLEAEELHQNLAIMTGYTIDILRMSENRCNELREMETPSNMLFLYSGRPNAEDEHREGVSFLISKHVC